jgi:hypothetical protein
VNLSLNNEQPNQFVELFKLAEHYIKSDDRNDQLLGAAVLRFFYEAGEKIATWDIPEERKTQIMEMQNKLRQMIEDI